MKPVTVTGVDGVAEAFTDAPVKVRAGMRAATVVAAAKIKDDARQAVTGLAHAPHYPRSITYDTRTTPWTFTAEIGPDRTGPQGPLGPILEYGTVNNPPRPHLLPALEREVPVWIRYLTEIAGDV